MFLLATIEYEKYVSFLVEHKFSSDKIYHSAYTMNSAIFYPTTIILLNETRRPETQELLSRNQRSPDVSVIDYAPPTWPLAASITLDEQEYATMYNRIREQRITHSARITPDYKIKVSFPDEQTPFLLQFNL